MVQNPGLCMPFLHTLMSWGVQVRFPFPVAPWDAQQLCVMRVCLQVQDMAGPLANLHPDIIWLGWANCALGVAAVSTGSFVCSFQTSLSPSSFFSPQNYPSRDHSFRA